jgi:hypothetical protein
MTTMSITGGSSISAGGSVTYITGRDTDNDFTLIGLSGDYQLDGKGGYDQLIVGEPSANFNVSAPDGNGGVSVSNAKVDYYLQNFENIVFTDRSIKPSGDQGPLAVGGTPGNDQLIGSSKDETFNGGDGLDTLSIASNQRTSVSLSFQGSSDWSLGGVGIGNDTLHSIERIAFADRMVALDVSAAGNAGQAMQFIGTIAPELLNELSIRGLIISLFDQGQSMLQLCELALQLDLIPHASNGELVNQVFQNVTGAAATKDMSDALVDYVEDHGQAEFLQAVAGLSLNVDLIGLQAVGLDYLA